MKAHLERMKLIAYSLLLLATFAGSATADAVSEMNRVATQSSTAAARQATQTTRIVAMTQIAIHDALNSIDPRYESYAYATPGDPSASPVAAIAAAGFNVLRIENPTTIGMLMTEYNALLATVPDGPAKE